MNTIFFLPVPDNLIFRIFFGLIVFLEVLYPQTDLFLGGLQSGLLQSLSDDDEPFLDRAPLSG